MTKVLSIAFIALYIYHKDALDAFISVASSPLALLVLLYLLPQVQGHVFHSCILPMPPPEPL